MSNVIVVIGAASIGQAMGMIPIDPRLKRHIRNAIPPLLAVGLTNADLGAYVFD